MIPGVYPGITCKNRLVFDINLIFVQYMYIVYTYMLVCHVCSYLLLAVTDVCWHSLTWHKLQSADTKCPSAVAMETKSPAGISVEVLFCACVAASADLRSRIEARFLEHADSLS